MYTSVHIYKLFVKVLYQVKYANVSFYLSQNQMKLSSSEEQISNYASSPDLEEFEKLVFISQVRIMCLQAAVWE